MDPKHSERRRTRYSIKRMEDATSSKGSAWYRSTCGPAHRMGRQMRREHNLLFLLFVHCLCFSSRFLPSTSTAAPVVFVSSLGNDANTGLNEENPVYTLRRASAVLRRFIVSNPGMSEYVVAVGSGEYFQNSVTTYFTQEESPPPFSRIVYKSVSKKTGTNRSIIYGGTKLKFEETESKHIFRARIPKTCTSLQQGTFPRLFDGYRSGISAREPNLGSGYLRILSKENIPSTDTTNFTVNMSQSFDCSERQCSMFVRSGYSSAIRTIIFSTRTQDDVASFVVQNGCCGPDRSETFVMGALGFLDSPGEYAIDKDFVYYYPYEQEVGAHISERVITTTCSENLLKFAGRSQSHLTHNIVFDGIDFVGAAMPFNYSVPGPGMPQHVENRTVGLQGLVYITNATNITIKNSRLSGGGISVVCLYEHVQNIILSSNFLSDSGGHGILIHGVKANDTRYMSATDANINHGHVIRNNYIFDGGKLIVYGSGIWVFQAGFLRIANNEISHFPRDCIGLYGNSNLYFTAMPGSPVPPTSPTQLENRKYWGKFLRYFPELNENPKSTSIFDILFTGNIVLEYNDLSRCNKLGLDGGVIESWGTAGVNNVWRYNAIHDNEGFGGAMTLLFADDGSPFLSVYSNILFENTCVIPANCGAFMVKSLNTSVYGNIVADSNLTSIFLISPYRLPMSNVQVRSNLVFNTSQTDDRTCYSLYHPSWWDMKGAPPRACSLNNPSCSYDIADLADVISWFGDELHGGVGQQQNPWQFGFEKAHLSQKMVEFVGDIFVDDARRLPPAHTNWDLDAHIINKSHRPFFKRTNNPWHSRTAEDYAVNIKGFWNDVNKIGVVSNFTSPGHTRFAFGDYIQAEEWDRINGLYTTQALGVGRSQDNSEKWSLPIVNQSWSKYDNINFEISGSIRAYSKILFRARVASFAPVSIVSVYLSDPDPLIAGNLVARLKVSYTNGNFVELTTAVALPFDNLRGYRTLFLVATEGSDFIVDWFNFDLLRPPSF